MGYIFISYSSKDGAEAEKMKLLLSDRGFETWMAPGDIPAGKKYASVIVSAIRDCSCFLLLLTENAQASTWVPKEVERAVSFKRPIVPVQLDELELNDEFSLYISTDQAVRVKSLFLNDEGMQHALASIRVHLAAAGGNEPDEASPEKNAPREEPLSFDADSDDDIFGEEFDAEPEFSRISRRGGTLIVRIFNSVMSVAAYPMLVLLIYNYCIGKEFRFLPTVLLLLIPGALMGALVWFEVHDGLFSAAFRCDRIGVAKTWFITVPIGLVIGLVIGFCVKSSELLVLRILIPIISTAVCAFISLSPALRPAFGDLIDEDDDYIDFDDDGGVNG